jgi:hypothetical protein
VADKSLELAYDAAKATLSLQDGTIGSIRNRATAMFTAAALAVSFTGTVGLISGDGKVSRAYPLWASMSLLAVMTLMATAVMAIQWPAKRFHFGPSAAVILARLAAGEDEDGIRRFVAEAMVDGAKTNAAAIKVRQRLLRVVVALLWLEIIMIVVAIVTT